MCELLETLIEENQAFAADIAAGTDPVVCFDGHFVAWDEIVNVCGNGGYFHSPIELIAEIVNERDALKEKLRVAQILLDVARAAWFLADNTCEEDGVLTIDGESFDRLSESLDKLDTLPEPGPNVVGTGPAKAAAILAP
jgi:hypothetical protein